MERKHVGTASNGTLLWSKYEQEGVRTYYDQQIGGNLVAIAISQDASDDFMACFCLPEIWDQGPGTSWASEDQLLRLLRDALAQ